MALVSFAQHRSGHQSVLNRTISASSNIRNRNVHTRPVISPWVTKNVMSSRRGRLPLRTAGSHHFVSLTISPEGLIIADIPVFAHLAIALRVSIARRLA